MKTDVKKNVPIVINERCISCGDCVKFCPQNAIVLKSNFYCARCIRYCMTMDVPCKTTHITIIPEICDGCGKCLVVCKNGAIFLENK